MEVMEKIAAAHEKTIAQVALNWLVTQERVKVVPIPGVRSVKQATDNAGALGWNLTEEERAAINHKPYRRNNEVILQLPHQRQFIDVFDDRVVRNLSFTDDAKRVTREEVLGSSAVENAPPI